MPVEFAEEASAYLGKGTVWLAPPGELDRAGQATWDGYWDLEPDGPPTPLESSPSFPDPDSAVSWGRERTPRVLIRLDETGGYWWAGATPCPPDLADELEGTYRISGERED